MSSSPLHRSPVYHVSIIIPLYQRIDLTRACQESLFQHATPDISCEYLFIDNASTDGTATFLQELSTRFPAVTIISNTHNKGFAIACNQGAQQATGDILVFLNNDTLVHEGWLAPLVQELDTHPQTGVTGSRLLYPDGRVQHAGVAVSRTGLPCHLFHTAKAQDPRVTQRRQVRMVTGACLAVRRAEYISLNGFDEGYINGHEDVDLCLRYGEAGYQVIYRPDSVLTHYESQSEGRFTHCQYNTQRTRLRWHAALYQDDFSYNFPESERKIATAPRSFCIKTPTEDPAAPLSASGRCAEALATALCRRGHRCFIHPVQDWGQDDCKSDITLVIPGPRHYTIKPYSTSVLWITDPCYAAPYNQDSGYSLIISPECVNKPGLDEHSPLSNTALLTLQHDNAQEALTPETLSPEELQRVVTGLEELPLLPRPAPPACSSQCVSILMATYNRRDTLQKAIDSVCTQSHPSWELIIVNDGGESVQDIIAAYNDTRIIYKDTAHVSKGHAINTAFSLSTGEYIAYLDDDDIWFPEHLQRALFAMNTLPDVAMTYADTLNSTLEIQEGKWHKTQSVPCKHSQAEFADLLECNKIPGITVVHTRALFEKTNGMDESLEVLIDFDMWRRLAMHTRPCHIAYVTAELFLRPGLTTTAQGQITNLHSADKRRYLAQHCKILRKPLPETLSPALHKAQRHTRKKVQALFLHAQAAHHQQQGNHQRAAACYRLAGQQTLQACRELIADNSIRLLQE